MKTYCKYCEKWDEHAPDCFRDNEKAVEEFKRGFSRGYSFLPKQESGNFYLKGFWQGESKAMYEDMDSVFDEPDEEDADESYEGWIIDQSYNNDDY